jgi:hypothetical protein
LLTTALLSSGFAQVTSTFPSAATIDVTGVLTVAGHVDEVMLRREEYSPQPHLFYARTWN